MFTVSAVVDAYTTDALVGPAWLTALVAASSGVAAFIRRTRPVTAIFVWALSIVILAAWLTPPEKIGVLFFGLLLFTYVVGSRVPGRRALVAPPLVLVAVTAVALSSDEQFTGDLIFPTIFGVLFWLAGRVVRSRTELTAELHEAALVAHEHREAAAARAVAEERRRIAREMHDVVAHSVSTMVIQAGGARRILTRDPARAIEAATLIERTGRDALRRCATCSACCTPARTWRSWRRNRRSSGLPALAERSRAAGLPVELHVEGEHRELPSGLDLAGYRVVQEALTNALKHGGGSAEVTVSFGEQELRLEIADTGVGAGVAPGVEGGGHGLVGMRERVRVFGGELHAGPRPEGGYLVIARLPLQDEDEAALAASTAGRGTTGVLG